MTLTIGQAAMSSQRFLNEKRCRAFDFHIADRSALRSRHDAEMRSQLGDNLA